MEDISRIISQLESNPDHELFGFINDINKMIYVLDQIRSIIGLNPFKVYIARLFKSFAMTYKKEKTVLSGAFLNMTLFGPPGSGKTKCGKMVAEFYDCIKFGKEEEKETADDTIREENIQLKKAINDIILDASKQKTVINRLRRRSKTKNQKDYAHLNAFLKRIEAYSISSILPGIIPTSGISILRSNPPFKLFPKPFLVEDKKSFIIVSRADIVEKYQGHTGKRVKDLIEKYKNGTIFIDEAYSLCTGYRDTFGMEAITEITNHMDKNPDGPRWIFAGYKDSLEKTIFKYQPGLRRRITGNITIDGYTKSELVEIFLSQLRDVQLEIPDSIMSEVRDIFNRTNFPDLGGSTKNMVDYLHDKIKCRRYDNIFKEGENEDHITVDDIYDAVDQIYIKDEEDTFIGSMYL